MCCSVCVTNRVLCVATCLSQSVSMCCLCQVECSNDCLRAWCFRVLAKAFGRGDGEDEELRSNNRPALCTRLSSLVCSVCVVCSFLHSLEIPHQQCTRKNNARGRVANIARDHWRPNRSTQGGHQQRYRRGPLKNLDFGLHPICTLVSVIAFV